MEKIKQIQSLLFLIYNQSRLLQHYNDPGVDSGDREEPNLQILDTIELGTSSHSVSGCQVKLETKVREDFSIAEKAPTTSPG